MNAYSTLFANVAHKTMAEEYCANNISWLNNLQLGEETAEEGNFKNSACDAVN